MHRNPVRHKYRPGEQYNIVREPQYQDIRKRMRAVLEKEARLRGRVINVGKEK